MKPVAHILRHWLSRPRAAIALLALCCGLATSLHAQPAVRTIAGGLLPSFSGNQDGTTFTAAKFNYPSGLALDPSGTMLFVADCTNNAVRLISNVGNNASSVTTTIARATNGISYPVAVAMDGATNLYVLNRGNGTNGTVIKFMFTGVSAHSIATNAVNLTNATAMALDGLSNLYVTIKSNTVIQITPAGGISFVGVITNTGTSLRGIAVLDNGNLALTDGGNNGIWVMNPRGSVSNNATQLTGFNGVGDICDTAAYAAFNRPEMIAKADGNMLVVADRGNHKVKLVNAAGTVTRLFGVSSNLWGAVAYPGWYDGTVNLANENIDPVEAREPLGVLVGSNGKVYDTEVHYHIIREITGTGLTATNALGRLPLLYNPAGIALDPSNTSLFIADTTNNAIQELDLGNNQTTTFLGAADGISQPVDVALVINDFVFVLNQSPGEIQIYDFYSYTLLATLPGLTAPTAFTMDGSGNIFVAEQAGSIHVFGNSGSSYTLATVTNAGVELQGIAILDDGYLAVSDAGNHVIWQINPITKVISKLTGTLGSPGTTLSAIPNLTKLNQPHKLARAAGNTLVAADYGNNRLVVVQRSGSITNVLNSTNSSVWFGRSDDPAATGNSRWVPMALPVGVAVGIGGNVYASEILYNDIRGFSSSLTQPPVPPYDILPYFNAPQGIALDSANNLLYIADLTNNAVEVLNLANNQTTNFLTPVNGISQPVAVVVDPSANIFVLSQGTGGNGSVLKFDKFGNLLATNATGLAFPTALTLDFSGNIYVAEQGGAVQEFTTTSTSNTIVTITNAGVQLQGIALFDDGVLALSDAGNHVIWQVNLSTLAVSILTGQTNQPGNTLGPASFAKLNRPQQMSRAAGNSVVVADYANNRLVVVARDGSITNVLNSTNSSVWFGQTGDPVANGNARWLPMVWPAGVAVGSGVVFSSDVLYNDIRKITAAGITPPPPPSPVAAPTIGWVDYTVPPATVVSVLRADPAGSYVFNNDVSIAILGTPATLTHYTYGDTASLGTIPNPDAATGSTPPLYNDGMYPAAIPPSIISSATGDVSDKTIKAIGFNPGSPSSPVVQARFQFITANPVISGNNGAQFTVTDVTTNAQMWWTTNGVDPINILSGTNYGPIASGTTLSINITTNVTFKIRAFRNNYQPSGVASTLFSATNFLANRISFGFESGEASSDFVASPGQNFYAPVTLSILSGVKMYSLQFNLTATNLTGPGITPGALAFKSMLVKPIPGTTPPIYETIPPAMFTAGPPPTNSVYLDGSHNFMGLVFTNSYLNLMGVGWLERYQQTNLYDTLSQDLITYSMAHDTMFLSAAGKVVAGGFAFTVPVTAINGQTYQIQIGRPSATSDGIGAPGSDVYIAAPTNGAISSLKTVTVGQRKYLVGDVYPFRWFNAGDFGKTNLVSADVMQVFQSAVYNLNYPPAGSDFFDGMDSCCGTVDTSTNGMYTYPASLTNTLSTVITNIITNTPIVTNIVWTTNATAATNYTLNVTNITVTTNNINGNNYVLTNITIYLTNILGGTIIIAQSNSIFSTNIITTNLTISTTAQLPLYGGDDTLIDSVAFGDGRLDVADVYVTFRRSLDTSRKWYERFWTHGVRGAIAIANSNGVPLLVAQPAVQSFTPQISNPVAAGVVFTAGDAITGAGQTLTIPITAQIFGTYPLRVLMLNLTVVPLDGSPAITTPVQFTPNKSLGTPTVNTSQGAGNYAAAWLNSGIAGLTGTASIGNLQVTLPAGAPANAAYAVHFDHASASPNGYAVFPKTAYTGLITLADRSASSYSDGIPDSWRLRWFGTIYDQLSRSNACSSGDGVNNWKKYVAGVDPSIANNFPSVNARTPVPSGSTTAIHWPTVSGKQYVIERSGSLFPGSWTAIATNTGTGTDMEFNDNSAGAVKFYRVKILP